MNMSLMRIVSRILIITTLAMGLPMTGANAGMIGTDQVVAQLSTTPDRDRVNAFLDRSEVQVQLQSMGISPQAAKDRVAALTDEEVGRLASKVDSMPAGAINAWGWAAVLAIIIWAVWYVFARK